MSEVGTVTRDQLGAELAERGVARVVGLVEPGLVEALRRATDRAVAEESEDFPPGDDQYGRVLFAPSHGGAFLDLLARDDVFGPIEDLIGDDTILYTMTTSALAPGSAGPVHRYHVDLDPSRPEGSALAIMVLLDRFDATSGATELLVGSHRWGPGEVDDAEAGHLLVGEPGDVCFFDPRIRHRSTTNRTDRPRRAVLAQMIRPWMKQRVDVAAMVDPALVSDRPAVVQRRLGLWSTPPRSRAEFLARRERRPWR
jgi:ectoine hydroxylase-related dioxygenase (phytanoyl-CoA dioxygenase family)